MRPVDPKRPYLGVVHDDVFGPWVGFSHEDMGWRAVELRDACGLTHDQAHDRDVAVPALLKRATWSHHVRVWEVNLGDGCWARWASDCT